MFVGSFMQWHGVQDIIQIAKNIPEAMFILIGAGPLYEEINIQSNELTNVILTGPINNVPKYLANSDITIAPFNTNRFTKLEDYGFWWCPVKLYEYMASGKPIVSYNFNEVRNIIKDSGLLAEPDNIKDFEEKINLLLKDKKLRETLGKKARKIALDYSWKKRAEKLKKILSTR